VVSLIHAVKATLSAPDQKTIDDALAAANKAADDAKADADKFNG
jgi:hypothetical protein